MTHTNTHFTFLFDYIPCFYDMYVCVHCTLHFGLMFQHRTLGMAFTPIYKHITNPFKSLLFLMFWIAKNIVIKHFMPQWHVYWPTKSVNRNVEMHHVRAILNYYLGLKIQLEKYDETMLPLLWLNECVNLISFVETSTYINITSRPRFFQCFLFLCSSKCNLSLSY